MKNQYSEISAKMEKTVAALDNEFKSIRAGRASAGVLDKIFVDYYGAPTPVNQLASISSPEARQLVIQPYDASVLKNIEKAIQTSDLGINPQNDGKTLRLIFPPLTEERRKELVKDVKKLGEDSKIAIRSIRRDAIEKFKADKKAGNLTEDDLKEAEKDIQELTDKFCKTIDGNVAAKEKEIIEI
ncbi:MAG: ribosome recycling factor [Clostridiales bacterium]|nr:ribosome recycling factor [Clostridiales bacterium]